ncbi:MAG: VWA domain-containing protein, partial [Gammaproteobacteria bacterium]|nr:VWA domain-containing protein [Gammaproteobacteria bacterium]
MKLKRRDIEVFSLSFLDVICCGFGAIILLLVLSEFGQPIVIERSRQDLESQIKKLQEELFVIRGESER